MNSPENVGLLEKQTAPVQLETSRKNVTVRSLDEASLPALKDLTDKNANYFMRGQLGARGIYDSVESEVTSGDQTNRRFGIYYRDELIGYIGLTATDNPDEFDIAYGIDEDNAGLGITSAAVKAVTEYEASLGHTITAEVESDNAGSKRVLKKLGFVATEQLNDNNRPTFVKK